MVELGTIQFTNDLIGGFASPVKFTGRRGQKSWSSAIHWFRLSSVMSYPHTTGFCLYLYKLLYMLEMLGIMLYILPHEIDEWACRYIDEGYWQQTCRDDLT